MATSLNFNNRNIAVTDLETTGLDANKHEIIEFGLVLVSQPHFEIVSTLDIKVKPTNIEAASPRALEVNGYTEEAWQDAISLEKGLSQYLEMASGAVFCAYNTTFDYPFIREACEKTGLSYTLDYHAIDIPSINWFALKTTELDRMNLSHVAKFLGIEPEPEVHRAINGAMTAYKVLKKLTEASLSLTL